MADNTNNKRRIVICGKGGGISTVTWDDIQDKPEFATVATTGDYDDLTDKPTILTQWFGTQAEYDLIDPKDPNTIYNIEGSDNVQPDWNQSDTTADDYIKNKPTIPVVNNKYDIVTKTQAELVDFYTNYTTIMDDYDLYYGDYPVAAVGTTQIQGITFVLVEYNPFALTSMAIGGTYHTLTAGAQLIAPDGTITPFSATMKMADPDSLATVATTGNYSDLNGTPTIPAAQVNADWNAVSGVAEILNKPTIPVVPAMTTETLTFTLQDSTTKTITFFTAITGYFYVEDASGSDNTLSIVKNNENAPTVEVFASTDQMSWTSMGSTSTTAITATIPANGKLYLKATANVWGGDNYNNIAASGAHNVGGNIMSLIYGDNFSNQTEFPADSNNNFANVFKNSTNIVSAANLILPATTLPSFAYVDMFSNSSLTIAPAIPAATIGFYSCAGMFSGCRALTTAPVISASIIGEVGCSGMFQNCTSLTTAPELPATTLNGSWCYSHIFEGCTSLTTAPELPATTIGEGCYAWMFKGCPNIDRVVSYAQTIGRNALSEWLDGASQTGDFYNLGGATYESGVSGIPTGWTEHTSL